MILRRNQDQQEHESEGGHYWISISDLMTSLLFIFILILAYVIFTFHHKSMADKHNRDMRIELLKNIRSNLPSVYKEQVYIDSDKGSMRVGSGNLFKQGEYRLKDQDAVNLIQAIGASIKKEYTSKADYQKAINTIFVEGHTDSDPSSGLYFNQKTYDRLTMSNQELSTLRAIQVFNVMNNENTEIDKMKNAEDKPLFSYSGYADTRPADTHKTAHNEYTKEAKDNNRRIEFFFALSSPKVE